MQRSPLENMVRDQISKLQQDDFQEFVMRLMTELHGTAGFGTVRRSKDQGADGLRHTDETVMACWGPDRIESSKLRMAFEKKAGDDFKSYKIHWKSSFPKWQFVMNREPAPEEIKFIKGLQKESAVMGLDSLVHIVMNELCSSKRRRICEFLKIPADTVGKDLIAGFLDDILQSSESSPIIEYKKPIYLPDKIELNVRDCEVDSVLAEIGTLQEKYFSAIKTSYREFGDTEIAKIKHKLVQDYNDTYGETLLDKINHQTRYYLVKYKSEDDEEFKDIIRAVAFQLFEACLLGKKTVFERAVL